MSFDDIVSCDDIDDLVVVVDVRTMAAMMGRMGSADCHGDWNNNSCNNSIATHEMDRAIGDTNNNVTWISNKHMSTGKTFRWCSEVEIAMPGSRSFAIDCDWTISNGVTWHDAMTSQ
jgi:hypothetical protein